MYYYPPFLLNQIKSKRISILDFKRGDVNGDIIPDNIYLVGEKLYKTESPFIENITLIIQDGLTGSYTNIPLKNNAGYNPTIFLGDFSGDKVNDILISIDSGGSGGYAFYYIYSFFNNIQKIIFDHEIFDEKYKYYVNYLDYYEVEVTSSDNEKRYLIDIKYKGEDYLSEIYDDNGKLKKPIEGWVNPLGGLYPIDFQRDGIYGLYAIQRIAGRYNADGLGYVQTSLEWDGNEFTPFFQTLGILG